MRQASRYSIGGSPTVRVKRSKNAERESAGVPLRARDVLAYPLELPLLEHPQQLRLMRQRNLSDKLA